MYPPELHIQIPGGHDKKFSNRKMVYTSVVYEICIYACTWLKGYHISACVTPKRVNKLIISLSQFFQNTR